MDITLGKEVGVWGKVEAISSISTNFSVESLLWDMDFYIFFAVKFPSGKCTVDSRNGE